MSVGQLSQEVSAYEYPIINVTFDGVLYSGIQADSDGVYGDYDAATFTPSFTNYPFVIGADNIVTENAGTYSIAIEGVKLIPSITPCFEASAVKALKSHIGTFNLLLSVSQASVSIPANSVKTVTLTLNSGYTIPDNVIGYGIGRIMLDQNMPSCVLNGVTILNRGEQATLLIANVSSNTVTFNDASMDVVGTYFL